MERRDGEALSCLSQNAGGHQTFSADEDPKSARGSTQIQRIHADPAEIRCGSV